MNIDDKKSVSRDYLRSLSAIEKIEKLAQLQEQYFQFLEIREANGGKPIPARWKKWQKARLDYSNSLR